MIRSESESGRLKECLPIILRLGFWLSLRFYFTIHGVIISCSLFIFLCLNF